MVEEKIAVVGLGYVGLPLAVAFARQYDVVGFDIDAGRVAALREGEDATNEVEAHMLEANICSTRRIAHSWGLTGEGAVRPAARPVPAIATSPPAFERESVAPARSVQAKSNVATVIEDALRAAGLMR